MHAVWNVILKQSEIKYVSMNWQVLLSGAAAIVAMFFLGLPPRSLWLFSIFSGILETLYFLLLMYAYTDHDFSLIYPIAAAPRPRWWLSGRRYFCGKFPRQAAFSASCSLCSGW